MSRGKERGGHEKDEVLGFLLGRFRLFLLSFFFVLSVTILFLLIWLICLVFCENVNNCVLMSHDKNTRCCGGCKSVRAAAVFQTARNIS